MRKLLLLLAVLVTFSAAAQKSKRNAKVQTNQPKELKLQKDNIDEIIQAMTPEEKANLIMGFGSTAFSKANNQRTGSLVSGAVGGTNPVDRLGVPGMCLADGPAGIHVTKHACTHFPNGSLLAATWNNSLLEAVGATMGDEMRTYGVDVILGPGTNILRNALCGRNFEYYSEDPLLSGLTAAGMVRGIQSQGVGACIKHFCANNQELNRLSNDARISKRALREIYFRNFEYTIKESDPWCVMTSYNWLNGVPVSENKELLVTLLRDEWKYPGVIMTDWGGGYKARTLVQVGNNLIEPGSDGGYNDILSAYKEGVVTDEHLNSSIRPILEMALKSLRFNNVEFKDSIDVEAHGKIVRDAATEGMVLLKNEKNALPLNPLGGDVAVLGIGSYVFLNGGTGSGIVEGSYSINLQQGLSDVGYTVDKGVDDFYNKFLASELQRCKDLDKDNQWFSAAARPVEALPYKEIPLAAKSAQAAVITIGRNFGESQDRDYYHSYLMSRNEKLLIKKTAEAFHKEGKPVVVILNVGGAVDVSQWQDMADAILVCWLPGEEGGHSVADILSGDANPSGRLPMTLLKDLNDDPTTETFPDYPNSSNRNLSFLRFTGLGRKYEVSGIDYTNYKEDIFVGYRNYQKNNIEVAYPFGFGLSYTTFDYKDLKVTEKGENIEVSLMVENTGQMAGKEVVQIYVKAPQTASLPMPERELRGYGKTNTIEPGKSQKLVISIPKERLASFDESKSAWVLEMGDYQVMASKDANTALLTAIYKQKKTWEQKTNDILGVEPLYIE